MRESQNKEKALTRRIRKLEALLSKAYNNVTREKIWKEIDRLKAALNEEMKNK